MMRRTKLFLALGVCVALVACEQVTEPLANDLQPNFALMGPPLMESVSGSGHYDRTWRDGSVRLTTFTFNARKDAVGEVAGRFQVNNHGRSWMKGIIKCFRTNAEEAWLGVEVESASRESLLGIRGFYVMDRGEGEGADPDILSSLSSLPQLGYESAEAFCIDEETPIPLQSFEIEGGNIWVKYDPPRSVYEE